MSASNRRRWTEADNHELARAVAQGWSRRAVAAHVMRSEGSVRLQMRKLGLAFDQATVRAHIAAGVAAKWQNDAQWRARMGDAIAGAWTDERRQRNADGCRGRQLWTKGLAAIAADPMVSQRRVAGVRAAARRRLQRQIPWCPAHLIDEYHFLTQRKDFPADEAERIVRDIWSRELARALAAIAAVAAEEHARQQAWRRSHEGQMARVAAGVARLVPAFRPARRVADIGGLYGSSAAMAADCGA